MRRRLFIFGGSLTVPLIFCKKGFDQASLKTPSNIAEDKTVDVLEAENWQVFFTDKEGWYREY